MCGGLPDHALVYGRRDGAVRRKTDLDLALPEVVFGRRHGHVQQSARVARDEESETPLLVVWQVADRSERVGRVEDE